MLCPRSWSLLRQLSKLRGFSDSAAQYRLVEVSEVTGFIERCLVAAGALHPHAVSLASVLVHADLRGHYSHGLNRLGKTYVHRKGSWLSSLFATIVFPPEMYCDELETGQCDGSATPKVLKETVATALVDGGNAIGSVSSTLADVASHVTTVLSVRW